MSDIYIVIHWNWIVFIIVVGYLIRKILSNKGSGGDYSFDFETSFWPIILIAYILIWGGIFWW
jgi:hypothetical protein